MTEISEQQWISGFWRRLAAISIDIALLALLGQALGFLLGSSFVILGEWGRLIGFFIALAYFGVMDSSIANGQTIGKKLLKIRLLDGNKLAVNPAKSVIRFVIFGVPYFLNSQHATSDVMSSPLGYPFSVIIFGCGASMMYLYVFNRATRQTLHDLLLGTFVVNEKSEKTDIRPIWKVHFVIVGLILISSAFIPIFVQKLSHKQAFETLTSVQSVLQAEPDVAYSKVYTGTKKSHFLKNDKKTETYLTSQVFLKSDKVSDKQVDAALLYKIIGYYPDALKKDVVHITLIYGYDIGIAYHWSSKSYSFNPSKLYEKQ